jgi:transcriptional regulator with XRE-family HTH domain
MAHEVQGALVRAWRNHARMSLTDVAARLHTVVPAMSNYEQARRDITFETMKALDEVFGAGGGLFDVSQGLGTPFALPARRHWAFHPQTARPVVAAHFGPDHAACGWLWLRPRSGRDRIGATLSWGSFGFEISAPCGDDGVFVEVPPALVPLSVAVELEAPGWVDQGRGPAPAHLGRPVLRLRHDARLRGRAEADDADADLLVVGPSAKPAASRFTGSDFGRLRRHRCYVLDDVAAWATALLPSAPVSVDAIRRFEHGAMPRRRFLRSRLDVVYEAGGWATDETVDVHGARERFELRFPEFWVGPVWFEVHAVTSTRCCADVRLRQGTRAQALRVAPGARLAAERRRRDAEPYLVTCPPGWTVRAGLGIRPEAVVVDLDPYPPSEGGGMMDRLPA